MNQIQQHIQQLNSPNPAARREAIIALGKLANPAAIGPLTQASENDPDPVLQEFARKAVRHIQKGQPQQVETIDATPETLSLPALSGEIDEIEEPSDALIGLSPVVSAPPIVLPTMPSAPPPKQPSARERILAKGHLEHAIGLRVSGDNEKSFTMLTEALRIDPGLANEPTAINLASALLNRPLKEAIQIVVQRSQDVHTRATDVYTGGIPRLKFDKEFWNFVLETGILLIVLMLFSIASSFGFIKVMNNFLSALQYSDQISGYGAQQVTQEAAQLRAQISQILPQDLFVDSLKRGVSLLFAVLLGNSITYGVGTLVGGTGQLFRFMSTLVKLQILTYIAMGAVLGVILYSGLQPVADLRSASLLMGLAFLILSGVGVISFLAHIILVGRAHEMGIGRGLLAVVIGGFISSFLISILGVFS